jgi:hypothetical protein
LIGGNTPKVTIDTPKEKKISPKVTIDTPKEKKGTSMLEKS